MHFNSGQQYAGTVPKKRPLVSSRLAQLCLAFYLPHFPPAPMQRGVSSWLQYFEGRRGSAHCHEAGQRSVAIIMCLLAALWIVAGWFPELFARTRCTVELSSTQLLKPTIRSPYFQWVGRSCDANRGNCIAGSSCLQVVRDVSVVSICIGCCRHVRLEFPVLVRRGWLRESTWYGRNW